MIQVTINEALYLEILAENLKAKADQIMVAGFERQILEMDEVVRTIATTDTKETLNSYRLDISPDYDGISPMSSEVGMVRHVRMHGTLGTLVVENGDVMVHDGGTMVNHSAWVRVAKQAIAAYRTE